MAVSASSESACFSPAVLIPVFNHENAITSTLEDVLRHGLPVLLVDDGSQSSCRECLEKLVEEHADTTSLIRLEQNGGKGAAVKAGFQWLHKQGYSHAIQIDADGQHNLEDLPYFIETARLQPNTLISGFPEYDDSIPKARLYGRYLTHVWVWINTLSFEIKDAMCGFRVYPLQEVNQLLTLHSCGNRMDFDPEVIVRWKWEGGSIINRATKVSYPIDGVSHFHVWLDNALISKMHTRLFFGMLYRLPKLLARKAGWGTSRA